MNENETRPGGLWARLGGCVRRVPGALAGAGRRAAAFFLGHKVVALVLLAALAVGGYMLVRQNFSKAAPAGSFSFIRTTTLQKTSLRESVTATGTVKSAGVSNVTIDSAVRSYKVKSVEVKVGDAVKEGDVILTLDTTDLLSDIEKAEEKLSENRETLLKSYNTALDSLSQAQTSYDQAVEDEQKAWETYEDAYNKYTLYESKKNEAWALCNSLNDQAEALRTVMENALSAYDSAVGAHNDAYGDHYTGTQTKTQSDFYIAPLADGVLTEVRDDAGNTTAFTYYDANGDLQRADVSGNDVDSARTAAQTAADAEKDAAERAALDKAILDYNSYIANLGSVDSAYNAYQTAKTAYDKAKADLQSAMTSSGYTEALSQYESYKQKMETAATSHKNAQRTTETRLASLTTARKNAEEALKKYNEGGTSDELDTLWETLDKCTVTASAAGTVTSVSATVGSMISDSSSVATIQETENLLVAITLEEYDVKKVAVGMLCEITSDATEGTIPGVVSTISPTSSQSGGFEAEVAVQGGSNGLLIGMNAQAEIIISSQEDVFTVPADAVGTDEEGSYILVRTSGSGTDAEFERVAVTVGDSNDYYVIVEGDSLREGMVVRATADLSVGAETTDDASAQSAGGLPGMGGGMVAAAPGGNRGGMGGGAPGTRGGN